MVFSKRFCTAPRSARWESIPARALSITAMARWAPSAEEMSTSLTEFLVALAEPNNWLPPGTSSIVTSSPAATPAVTLVLAVV
ncbi:hypothetical protein D3C76_1637370 [compost metagenome]